MKTAILKFPRDEKGAAAIECGVVAGMSAIALVAVFGPTGALGTALTGLFGRITAALNSAT